MVHRVLGFGSCMRRGMLSMAGTTRTMPAIPTVSLLRKMWDAMLKNGLQIPLSLECFECAPPPSGHVSHAGGGGWGGPGAGGRWGG